MNERNSFAFIDMITLYIVIIYHLHLLLYLHCYATKMCHIVYSLRGSSGFGVGA